MLGYGLLNSKIHEICLKGIIKNFLSRMLFVSPYFYSDYKSPPYSFGNDTQAKALYKIFLLEEKKISCSSRLYRF